MKKRKRTELTDEASEKNLKRSRSSSAKSIFVFLLDKLSDVIYNAFIGGFFGYIFTAYSSELASYEKGYIYHYFKGNGGVSRVFRRIRMFLSESFESSFALKFLKKIISTLVSIKLKTYGSFFLAFGIYTVLTYLVQTIITGIGTPNNDYLFIGTMLCITSLPLHFSKKNLMTAVKDSRFLGSLFIDGFGYRDEVFEKSVGSSKTSRSGIAILLGLLFGSLTIFISPLDILSAIFIFCAVALIFVSPEIGILLSLFSLPLLSLTPNPTLFLSLIVLITAFSFFIKLIRGKRIVKFELLDLAVLFFAVLIHFSGAITVGGSASYLSATVSVILLLVYFLVVNLIRTYKWIHRCITASVFPAVLVAIIGIVQYVLGNVTNAWLDVSYFPSITGRATALFENPNYLAAYLTVIFPFVLYLMFTSKTRGGRILSALSAILIAICVVLTWSRAAWIAIIVCTTIYFIFYSRKTLRYLYLLIASVPVLAFLLPENVVSRFMSIGDLADSSTLYRVYTWKGSVDLIGDYFWGGIGYGTEAFAKLYPIYAYSGMENAVHSHSLYLQILISMGIVGLISFAILIFFYFQKNFEFIKNSRGQVILVSLSSVVAVISMLIMGLFDYVWYNYRIYFLFWALLAIGVALIRVYQREALRTASVSDEFENCAQTDVDI